MATYPKCNRVDCFANKCGCRCDILTDYPTEPCSFYKTEQELDMGRLEAHNHLKNEGREDLIRKYEYNAMRRW